MGEYRLARKLGGGGFGTVYLAEHIHEHVHVAVKILKVLHDEDLRDFINEARMTMRLRHPHIIPHLDFGLSREDLPFLVMEYIPEGKTIRDRHPKSSRVPLVAIVEYVEQIASALQYAHDHHVIHRDVKPENMLLRADGTLLLSDFGIAKIIEHNSLLSTQKQIGTPAYMAPEQLDGYCCYASDQYALAVVIYEWIGGRRPFRGSPAWQASQDMEKPPPSLLSLRPTLSPSIEQVICKALSKAPEQRFASVQEFATAFCTAVQESTVSEVDMEKLSLDGPLWKETLFQQCATPASIYTEAPINILQVFLPPLVHQSSEAEGVQMGQAAPPHRVAVLSPKEQRSQALVPSEAPPAATLQHQNRTRLLQRVRSFWIAGVLEQSLHGAALMTLGLQEQPDAVANPWRLVIRESEYASTPLPTGTRITEVYDEAHGELLILGEPGAGKTTLLLELARDLLERSQQEQTHPIPVVFNLSSWIRRRQSLTTWLIEELETKYWVPRIVGSDWINANQILPLLDGLDEVDAASRPACMQAINEYRQEHNLVPLVVCCRVNEYMAQENQLKLARAVTIQPLTTEQVNEYFARIGESIASLRMVFQSDPVLQELATTPLMLTILTMVYQNSSLEEIKGGVSTEVCRQQIFATYTQRMLERRSASSRASPQQTVHWLSYLARQMKQQSQMVFYLERMQPTWLMKKWQRQLYYGLSAGPICGLLLGLETLGTVCSFPLSVLITALFVGLLFGCLSEPEGGEKSTKIITRAGIRIRQSLATSLENRVVIGGTAGLFIGLSSMLYLYVGDFAAWSFGSRIAGTLTGGLLNGMYLGVCVGLVVRLEKRIEPLEVLSWSWTGIRRDMIRWLLIGTGLILGLICAISFMMSSHDEWLANFLSYGFSTALSLILVVMLVSGVTRGLSKRVLAQHIVTPNQGIWRSARYGVIMAIITGGIAGIFVGVIDFLAYFWVPPLMGSAVKPLDMDYSVVRVMSRLLRFSPTTAQEFWGLHALFWGLVGVTIPGLTAGLSCGGAAYVKHFVLRFLLWCSRCIPFNYAHFLDYAAERIFLRKVGGGYIFMHRLLLDYFADREIDTDRVQCNQKVSR
jgi:serine/threonine protein kinase/DNA polymerase III delta prime subunit